GPMTLGGGGDLAGRGSAHGTGELGSGADAELAVGVGEVDLDCLDGDVEGLCDLLVGHAVGGEMGDAAFADGQGVHAGQHEPAGAGTECRQFALESAYQPGCSGPVGDLEATPEQLVRLSPVVGRAEQRREV